MGLDIICHLLVPSPSIARDHEEQAEYERLHTSSEATEPISCCDFITAFLNMITGKMKKEEDDDDKEEEEAAAISG